MEACSDGLVTCPKAKAKDQQDRRIPDGSLIKMQRN